MTSRHLYIPAGRCLAFLWRTKDLVSWTLGHWAWLSSSRYMSSPGYGFLGKHLERKQGTEQDDFKMEEYLQKKGTTKDMWQTQKRRGCRAQGARFQNHYLKLGCPCSSLSWFLLTRKRKGPGRGTDLLSPPSCWIFYECSFMIGRMAMWTRLIFVMCRSQPPGNRL